MLKLPNSFGEVPEFVVVDVKLAGVEFLEEEEVETPNFTELSDSEDSMNPEE